MYVSSRESDPFDPAALAMLYGVDGGADLVDGDDGGRGGGSPDAALQEHAEAAADDAAEIADGVAHDLRALRELAEPLLELLRLRVHRREAAAGRDALEDELDGRVH